MNDRHVLELRQLHLKGFHEPSATIIPIDAIPSVDNLMLADLLVFEDLHELDCEDCWS